MDVPSKEVDTHAPSEELYRELGAAGVPVLYDDRAERAGVKFNDADLLGIPIRLTLGKRSLKEGGVELKRRDRDEKEVVPLDSAIARIRAEIAAMQDALQTKSRDT
jgi:prolyl-tRNA synthetase